MYSGHIEDFEPLLHSLYRLLRQLASEHEKANEKTQLQILVYHV